MKLDQVRVGEPLQPLEKCTALRNGRCTNGFPTDAVCAGFGGEKSVPICMDERRCARLFPHTGAPPFQPLERQ